MSSNKHQDAESNSDNLDDADVQVSLDWLQRKFGRFLELFLILQFGFGVCLFFSGIFFLVWAVAPIASLQAGSYMLLAFFIIGRALLGIIGYYTDNFCLLFSYGVILLATFVLRTIMIMVRLKIMVSPDHRFIIPPLLQAAPGAMATYIEMLCAILECLQTFCSFYLCWIMSKKRTIAKEEDESKLTLNIVNEVARYLYHKEASINRILKDDKEEQENEQQQQEEEQKEMNKIQTAKQDKMNINDKRRKSSFIEVLFKKPSILDSQKQTNTNNNNTTTMPLKGILHQSTTITSSSNRPESTYTTQTHHFDTEQQQYRHQCPAKYDINNQYTYYHYPPPPHHHIQDQPYSHQMFADFTNASNYSRPTNNHRYGIDEEYDRERELKEEIDDELRTLDYHNNNHPQQQQQQQQYGRISSYNSDVNKHHWFFRNHNRSSFEDYSPDDDDDDDDEDDNEGDNVGGSNDEDVYMEPRVRPPIPSTVDHPYNSPLLYERMNVFQNYGATSETIVQHQTRNDYHYHQQQRQQFHNQYAPMYH